MQKLLLFLIAVLLLDGFAVVAQTGIGTVTPNPSAELDISSTTRGFLPPRMTAVQRSAITAPAQGLVVYDTDSTSLMIYNGSAWVKLSASLNDGWNLNGNAGTTAANFIGTTDNQPLRFKVNNQQAGIIESATANTALGISALESNTTGTRNSVLGYQALTNNTTGGANTAVGEWALRANTSASSNTAIGSLALYANTTGGGNTAVGDEALRDNISGSSNAALGTQSLSRNTTGTANTGLGRNTLIENTTGVQNTAAGYFALRSNVSGTANTALGFQADVNDAALTNATAIGANARVDASNSMVLGSIAGINTATANTKVGIGTTTPQQALHVNGQVRIDTLASGSAADSIITVDANGVMRKRNVAALAGPWATDGTNIYSTNSENVGIGLNNPQAKLEVRTTNNHTAFGAFSPQGIAVTGVTDNGMGGYFTSTLANGTGLMVGQGKTLLGGDVLIGGGILDEKLVVNGAVRLSNSNDPAASLDGTIRYVSGVGFQGKHNNAWVALAGTPPAIYTAGSGISINGSNVISAADDDPTNELQSLVLNGNQLSITGIQANPITLPGGLTLPYDGSGFNSNGNALFKVTHTGSVAAIEGVNNGGHAVTGTTQNGTALRAVATHSGGGIWSQTNTGDAGYFLSVAGNAVIAQSAGNGTAGSFTVPTGTALFSEGTVKLKTTGAAAGKFLMATDANGTVEWVNAPGGGGSGGSGNWTLSGNDIYNDNSGGVLVGTTTTTTNGIMEVTKNSPNGRVASFYNSGAAYMSVLNATENGTSGNPAGCDVCVGSKAINAVSTYGDALFARSTNGRGIYLKGGSMSHPAMLIETNTGVTTALEMNGALKIVDGTQGLNKVLTSDAFGNASWQTPAGGGGGTLDAAYNFGGGGAGRSITANNGAMKVAGTDGLLVTGIYGSGADPELSGEGTRMFFNPRKAAFRAGYVSGTEWDNANIGNYSVAMGFATRAEGWSSTALGQYSSSDGLYSTAMGYSASASGMASTAAGNYAWAAGDASVAMGYNVKASSYAETVIGAYSTNYTPVSATSWDWGGSDRLFTIGNGTSNFTRSDALVVYKSGSATLSGTLTQSSDKRLKRNIMPLQNSLEKVLKLNGYSYQWNKELNKGDAMQIGFVAQEVETLFPELVVTDANGMKSVAYQNLVPVLVEAIKELKKENETLKNANAGLKADNTILNSRSAEIETRLSQIEALLQNGKLVKE